MNRIAARGILLGIGLLLVVSQPLAGSEFARFFGTVFDDKGKPLENVTLALEPTGDQGARAVTVTRGNRGNYMFDTVRAGTYVLKVQADGLAIVSMKARATAPSSSAPVWQVDGKVRPANRPQLKVEGGMQVQCDVVVGSSASAANDEYATLLERVRKGDCGGALSDLESYAAANPSGRAYYLLGFCNGTLKKEDAAIDALKRAAELDPGFAGTHTLLAQMYERKESYGDAEAAYRKELANPAAAPQVQADAWAGLGRVLRIGNRTDAAIEAFEKVIELAPSRPESYVELSSLYTKAGKPDRAAAVLAQAKKAGVSDPVALLNLGVSNFNKKDYAAAEAVFREVIDSGASDENLALAYGLLGRCQLRKNDTSAAVASLKKSLALDPKGRLAAETANILKSLKQQ